MSTRQSQRIRRGTAPSIAQDKRALQTHWYDAIAHFLLEPCEQSYAKVARMVHIAREAMRLQGVRDFDVQIQSAQRALDVIFDRWEDTGLVVAQQLEKQTIRAASQHIADAIESASILTLDAAIATVKAEMEVQGVPLQDLPRHSRPTPFSR